MELNQQLEAANRRARKLQASLPRAVSAHFDWRTHRIVIQLNSRIEIAFSPQDAEGLADARPAELEPITISPSGFGIHFPRLEADLYLPALLAGILGSKQWMARRQESAEACKKRHPKHASRAGVVAWPEQRKQSPSALNFKLIRGSLPAPRPPERADPQIKKDRHDNGSGQEHPVIGAVSPTGSHAPEIGGKHNYGQEKEYARNFKPQHAAHPPEWTQKAADAARDASAGLGSGSCSRLYPIDGARNRLGLKRGLGLRPRLGVFGGSGLSCGCQPFAGHLPGDAQSGAEDAANDLWSHSVYDGSSDPG